MMARGSRCNPDQSRGVVWRHITNDAAAQCSPITGGGMRAAFYAGKHLADKIVKSLSAGSLDSRTRVLQETGVRFSAWWRKTPYESQQYVNAHDTFERMSTGELERFSNPIRVKGLKIIMDFLKNAKWWWLYRAFLKADKYSW
jgi:flavin-dependent dehydrogenase